MLGNGTKTLMAHIGFGTLQLNDNCLLSLNDVFYALKVARNLLLINKLCTNNKVSIEFSPTGFCVKDLPPQKVKL